MRRTLYDTRDLFAEVLNEQTAAAPSPFKIYRDVARQPLHQSVPLRIGDARWSFDDFAGRGPGPAPDSSTLGSEVLSPLLYYTYGFSRQDEGPGAAWPFHRTVPSARCLFPTEVYLWLPGTPGITGGVHHYDNLHHGLSLLRPGDHRAELSAVLDADLSGAHGVLIFSSLFWKNAHKYRAYSYRLCAQEAGMVVGNALLVGAALGLRGHVHYQFVDGSVGSLLGLDADEEHVFAVVPLHSAADTVRDIARPGDRAASGARPLPGCAPISPTYLRTGDDQYLGELFTEIARNSTMEDVSEFVRETPRAGPCPQDSATSLPIPAAHPGDVELAEALRRRDSGNVVFNPVAKSLPSSEFWEILRHASDPYVCDLRCGDAPVPLELYVVPLDVVDVEPAVYRFCPIRKGLDVVQTGGDVPRALQDAIAVANINLYAANVVLYIAGDHAAASRTFGNRGYRILHMEGGLVAQRICVMSAAFSLSARIHNGYETSKVKEALGIGGSPLTPLFQVVVAHNRPGVQYGLPIVF